jgi:uncharacterized protein
VTESPSPDPFVIRDAAPADFAAVLAHNHADVASLAPLASSQLERLALISSSFRVAEEAGRFAGFLLAISSDCDHQSLNFAWFKQRYPRFIYVDRVVVAERARRLGVASRLYADLEAHAATIGAPLLTCEVNVRPSNAASLAFHQRLGFESVGIEARDNGEKTVSMLVKRCRLGIEPLPGGSRRR